MILYLKFNSSAIFQDVFSKTVSNHLIILGQIMICASMMCQSVA